MCAAIIQKINQKANGGSITTKIIVSVLNVGKHTQSGENMKNENEIQEMIHRLWKIEARAPSRLKEGYQNAAEVLEWALGKRPEDDVILFGE